MRRWHFYVMGVISLVFGLLSLAEYVLVSYGMQLGWLDMYPPEQIEWLTSLPGWVHGLWGVHATLALVGALCLITHLKPAVWMFGISFVTLIPLYVWALFIASPTLITLVGGGVTAYVAMALVLLLSFLIYLYTRQEKHIGEVL